MRRNLIIILAHGLRSDAVSGERAWPLPTPGFDKLAARGLRLVATSACPADPGGLVSLYTGLHARQHGQFMPSRHVQDVEGWPALLREAGYHLAGVGKIGPVRQHLHQAVGVEEIEALEPVGCSYLGAMQNRGLLKDVIAQRRQRLRYGPFEPDRLDMEPDNDVDGYIAAEAQRMLDQMPPDRPWALIVSFTGPANDLPAPHLYNDLIEPSELAQDFVPADLTHIDALVELDYPRVLLQRLNHQNIGRIRCDYLGRVSLIDYGVSRLLSRLERRDDASRTWTMLGSDRGHLLGEHGVVGHRSFLGVAVETPLILAPPTPCALRSSDDLVSVVDIAPTLALLGGCDPAPGMLGRSLLPLIAEEPLPLPPGGMISEYGDRLLLETERYKLVCNRTTRKTLGIYDLLSDPDELKNLHGTPQGINLLDALRWRLADALLPLTAPSPRG